MADLLGIAVSGLEAFQQALAVTGNNISNASTPGYTREQVNLDPSLAQNLGGGYVGSGVDVNGTSRILDQFAQAQAQSANQSLAQQSAYVGTATQVSNILGNSSNGIASALTAFYNSFQALTANPASTTLRSSVLTQAGALAQSISQAGANLSSIQGTLSGQVTSTVTQINSLTTNIAALNSQITQRSAQGPNQTPNTLLDQRDQLVSQLGQLIGIKTNTEANGAIDVYAGSGQALVVGTQVTALSTQPGVYNASQLDVTYGSGSGAVDITGQISGGSLGGYLQSQSQILEPAINGLGQIATAVGASVNAQQAQGVTASNTIGSNIFTVPAPTVTAASTNSTKGYTPTASLANVSSLTTSNYVLKYTISGWTATDATTGATLNVSPAGVPATIRIPSTTAPSVIVTLPSGNPSVGDSFLVQPTAAAATGFAVSLADPNGIAAAGFSVPAAAASNTGTASISAPTPATATLPTTATTITFSGTAPNLFYSITNGSAAPSAPAPFTAGASITSAPSGVGSAGWSFTISGVPKAGDTFTIPAPNGTGNDNRNAVSLAALQAQGVLDGGSTSSTSGYSTLVGQIGSQTQAATTAQKALQAVATQANERQQNISGVNLDEEGANLVKWQQAYTAAGKVISVASSLFTTLINDIP